MTTNADSAGQGENGKRSKNGKNGHSEPKKHAGGRPPTVTDAMKPGIVAQVRKGVPVPLIAGGLDVSVKAIERAAQRDHQFRRELARARVALAEKLIGKLISGKRSSDISRLPWLMGKLFADFADKPKDELPADGAPPALAGIIFDSKTLRQLRAIGDEAEQRLRKAQSNGITSPTPTRN